MLALNGTFFGFLVLSAAFFGGVALLIAKLIHPNKAISMKLVDTSKWTPEMEYINKTRLITGFLLGMLITGTICILVYTTR